MYWPAFPTGSGGSRRASLEAGDSDIVLVEALRLMRDRLGKDPKIVPKAFGNHVEVSSRLFALSADLGFEGSETTIYRSEAAIYRSEAAVHRSEATVHRSLKLRNSHLAASDHNIVMIATMMPTAYSRETRANSCG